MSKLTITFLISLIFFSYSCYSAIEHCQENNIFNVGTGIYDITGPAAEEGMMGYGMLAQQTTGMYQRLWARAFIIESPCNDKRVVLVNVDLGQVFQGIKQQVVTRLKDKYASRFDDANVLITATHTHSGPGGYSTDAFYNLSTLGFSQKNFDAIVNGIVAAIERAQHHLTPATIQIASGELSAVGYNRSPTAYLLNPQQERDRYLKDTDTQMILIRFDSLHGLPLGEINWFPVHGVSMNNKNHLISGDNKGYAEYIFEKDFNSNYGPTAFVAAFAQANAGDVSPNANGHKGGRGLEGLSAVEKAGLPQYVMAKKLFDRATHLVTGGIDYRHTFATMDSLLIAPDDTDGRLRTTCPAAIGVSMLAGTQDGEGLGRQGIKCNDISRWLPHFICKQVTTACQGVKPIVLSTGTMKPYPWTPNILPLQILQIGSVIIIAAPFELTTMTGRRLREAISKQFPNETIILSTLANAYAGYVTTNEEYQAQRYEGASTYFGPWTQAALQQEYTKLATALRHQIPVETGLSPPDLSHIQINLQPGVIVDSTPWNKHFGDLYQDAKKNYQAGETVKVIFWGAHPKNDYRIQDSFLAIQQLENGQWRTIKYDRDWDTEYHWRRHGIANSLVTIVWRTPFHTQTGQYRIVHYGNAKSLWSGRVTSYVGYSSAFEIRSKMDLS
ncbi:MAG: hypothetical protein A3F11_05000 [Gammaproteobacteria bacterium RIFCSPHIGHO2_12_FULL_37_14]|nr:MAG: hypothetical protein A3F11_05000 [Gammaproteobacteria bacterium RIFCSPHIGHO2_12_FULL_37_14]